MKIKKIMLITLMLLAVLAIGAVSAADDTASDNMTVTDESVSDDLAVDDAVADDNLIGVNYDSDVHGISVNDDEEIDISDDDEYIADIMFPNSIKGSFKIYNGNEIVASQDFKSEDKTVDDENYGWYDDGDDITGYITMGMFNLTKVSDGDVLTFKFLELKNSEYTVVDWFTVQYNVALTDSTMQFTKVGGSGLREEDFNITVDNIDFNKPDVNFTFVNATQKAGLFVITTDGVDDPIFVADLSKAFYEEVVDDALNTIYVFGFSINDINNYISQNLQDADSLKGLVNDESIESDDSMYFGIYEKVDDVENDDFIYQNELTVTISSNGNILFTGVTVNYEDYVEIEMKDGWNETELYVFTIRNGIKGTIVIYVNNSQTPAFNKSLNELQPEESDVYDSNDYIVTVADLNITEEGEYELYEYVYDENGKPIHEYAYGDQLIIVLHEPKEITVGNVTIKINTLQTTITGKEDVISIFNASENLEDVLLVYVDDNKEPIQFIIRDCNIDDEGNGFINASKLNIGEGRYNLMVSYKGKNLTAPVNLVSNLEINIFDGERIYTTFDEVFAYFSLREGDDEIISSNINGTVNVTIRDANGNVVDTFEQNIYDKGDGDYYVVRSNNDELNGNYTVVIRYFDGNEAATQSEGIVSFKAFDPNDYGASINESVKDVNNRVITFKDVPIMDDNIYVKIDGNITMHFPISEIKEDLETGEFYIKFSQLGKLADGQHFISVYIESTEYYYDLTNGTVIVDVVENIDPSLTISIANITEGAAANIVISTNETFTGDVLVKIGNNNYTVSVTNGTGSLPVTGLAVGTHNATAFFKVNAIFNESTKNTTFTVNPKVATSVTAPAVTTTYATSKNIVVTLKDANGNTLAGKEVVITFNGASKNVKTNDKGQAVLAIGTKLAPKKYDATFKFAGDSNYLASTGTVKVTVNKAKPKITAKKKTFKAKKKTKKYTIVLKTDKKKPLKNVKVTIKVGKKTYKAKTNKKGKATFKLKKLTKKGKYKATIKFKGNKYYKAVSKKVKITVKK